MVLKQKVPVNQDNHLDFAVIRKMSCSIKTYADLLKSVLFLDILSPIVSLNVKKTSNQTNLLRNNIRT